MGTESNTIGFVFTGGDNWIGGLYYVVNIVKGIQFLPTNEQPKIVLIFDNKTPKELIKECSFPNVALVNINNIFIFRRLVYSMLFRILNKNFLFHYIVQKNNIKALYPFNEYHKDLEFLNCDVYYWIFDFQHKFLPNLFSVEEILRRDTEFKNITDNARNIVVSSFTAQKHFQQYYPNYNGKLHVLQFASIINQETLTPFLELKSKYEIDKPYYMVSNQFWIHKNHWVVLKAIRHLKDSGFKTLIIFTGKEYDPRDPSYAKELKAYIQVNKLNEFVKFLGFISREDQLGLMKHCQAVIQPSKFEGWGTVVEDAKTLNIPIILSNIEIHKEQYPQGLFFDEDDEIRLAEILMNFSRQDPAYIQRNTRSFALKIKEIFLNE